MGEMLGDRRLEIECGEGRRNVEMVRAEKTERVLILGRVVESPCHARCK